MLKRHVIIGEKDQIFEYIGLAVGRGTYSIPILTNIIYEAS